MVCLQLPFESWGKFHHVLKDRQVSVAWLREYSAFGLHFIPEFSLTSSAVCMCDLETDFFPDDFLETSLQ